MDVWHVNLDLGPREIEREARVLDASEQARAARLRGPLLQRRFIAAHAALRRILGERLHRPPASLSFSHEAGGRPRLTTDAPQAPGAAALPHFSLSHAGDHALVAVSDSADVGIDLECDPAAAGLADDLQPQFAPEERAQLARLRGPARDRAACRCWVRKEALLKALGCGLAGDPARLAVSCGARARLLHSRWPGIDPASWSLASVERPGHWIGAAAQRGTEPRLQLRHWRWTDLSSR